MPLYDFRCTECGHITEDVLQRTTRWDEMPCPECDGKSHRMPSAPARVDVAGEWTVGLSGSHSRMTPNQMQDWLDSDED